MIHLPTNQIFLSLAGVFTYARGNWYTFCTLGLRSAAVKRHRADSGVVFQQLSRSHVRSRRFSSVSSNVSDMFYRKNPHLLVFVYYWLFITLYCLCLINIQVMTRFIASSCPVLYWFGASVLVVGNNSTAEQQHQHQWRSGSESDNVAPNARIPTQEESNGTSRSIKQSRRFSPSSTLSWRAWLLLFYFVAYGATGCVMFCNFYPWT